MMKIIYRKALVGGVCFCWLMGAVFGQTNQVLSLNGTSAYVSVPSSPTLQPSNAITVEAWIYPVQGASASPYFINNGDGQNNASQRTYELTWAAGVLEFDLFLNQSTWAAITAPAASNQWVHVAATYNSSAGLLQLYTNGVLAASTTLDASGTISLAGQKLRQTFQPLLFGVCLADFQIERANTWASGYLDEIRIWNTNRSGIQIAESRFCHLTGAESNLVAYWNFDGTNAVDLTGHGNNGTLEGAVIVPINGQDTVHDGVCGAPYFDRASLSFSTNTGFHQKIYGPSGMTLEIERSTNLTEWSPLLVLPNFNGEIEFYDVDATDLSQSFYKIVPQ
jgi:hypothetical protein